MTRSDELLFADVFETLIERSGLHLGTRTPHDGLNDTGLTLDFTYEESSPRIALEITTIQDSDFLRAGDAAGDLANRLSAIAKREGLAPFAFTIKSTARIRGLAEPLLALMRSGRTIRAQDYSSDDLIREERAGTLNEFIQLHRRLEALDVVEAELAPPGSNVVISTWGSNTNFRSLAALEEVIADNLAKLVAAGPEYQRHLAVYVAAYGISQFAETTPVPVVPVDLNCLWIFHDSRDGSRSIVPWSVSPGQRSWLVHSPVVAPLSVRLK